MVKSRTILQILIAVAFVAILSPVAFSQWKGTIEIWDFPAWSENGDNYAWIKRMMAEYTKKNPNVTFKLTEIPWQGGDQKLNLAVASKTWPDLTRGPLRASFVEQGAIVDVTNYVNPRDYYDGAIRGATYKGRIYGFPFYMTTKVVIINKKIFKEKNVRVPTLDNPWTFEEFYSAARTMTYASKGSGKPDIFGFVASGMPPDNTHLWPFFLAHGGDLLDFEKDEVKPVLVSKENEEALNWLRKLFNDCAPPYMASYGDADAYTLFRSGKAAIYVTGTWAIPPLLDAGLEIDVAPYPVKKPGDRLWSFGDVSSYQIFQQKDPEKLKILVDFARTITSAQQQQELVKYGQFPTLKAVGNIYKNEPLMTKAAEISKYNYVFPPHPLKDNIIETISREIQLALLGKKAPAQALKDAESNVLKLLATLKK